MTTLYAWGGGLLLIAGLVWFIYWIARRLGRNEAKLESAEKGLDHAKEALEIDERVKSLPDDERAKWLYGGSQK